MPNSTADLTLPGIDEETPVERTVDRIIELAAKLRASDLFFAMEESTVSVACRHMGVVRSIRPFSSSYGRRMMNYVKTVAEIDLGERLRPSEGRWLYERAEGEAPIDLRINCIPTIFGEDITIRLLDRQFGLIPLTEFGFQDREYQLISGMLRRSSGLILVSGPTGSGKSTTMYSCLNALNDGSRKINTLEDPVEYVVKGIRQSQVNARLGIDFADLLMACLRQSPDVIMVGEIRDAKTARVAVRAAASGHLVLATLHASLAVKAIRSMVTMGVPVLHFAESLLGIMSQRLVRELCPNCRRRIELPETGLFLSDVRHLLPKDWTPCLYEPRGCEECLQTGYIKPLCIPEILTLDNEMRARIAEGASIGEIDRAARGASMVTFRESAMTRVALGQATIEDVMRVIPFDDLRDFEDDWEQPLKDVSDQLQEAAVDVG